MKRERGDCRYCGRRFDLNDSRRVPRHDDGDQKCKGSHQPPRGK